MALIFGAAMAVLLGASAQSVAAIETGDIAEPAPAIVVAPAIAPLVLKRDTPVHFMVVSEVTTKTHTQGHRFRLRVDKPVFVDGVLALPVGTIAWGEVLAAKKSGNAGKSGSLEARLLYVDVEGYRVPISGNNEAKGAGGGAETALGVLALGPLGLLAKGNNAKIKAGELMTGFVEQDTEIPRPKTAAP
jgi:DNA-binding XRE family transcriptional regulator